MLPTNCEGILLMKIYCNPMGTFPENHIFEPNSVLAIPMAWRTSPLHFAPQATYIPNGALKSASFDFFWDTSTAYTRQPQFLRGSNAKTDERTDWHGD